MIVDRDSFVAVLFSLAQLLFAEQYNCSVVAVFCFLFRILFQLDSLIKVFYALIDVAFLLVYITTSCCSSCCRFNSVSCF